MAIDFPASPTLNDTFTASGVTYTWDGTVWVASGSAAFVQKSGDTITGNLTLNADLTVDTNTLYVDSTNNRVGIVEATPAVALDVNGEVRASTGILFGTDTAAANTLDDYEEGTWTPSWVASGTVTTDLAVGNYTKIGDLVFLFFIIGSTGTPTSTDNIEVDSLPFVVDSSTSTNKYQGSFEAINFTVNSTTQYSLAATSSDTILIRKMTSTGGNTASKWSEVSDTSNFEIRGTIIYKLG